MRKMRGRELPEVTNGLPTGEYPVIWLAELRKMRGRELPEITMAYLLASILSSGWQS